MFRIAKRTPLYNCHVELGANIIDFGGWEMPVQYSNVIDEHNTTRTKVGLFDICHMGEFRVRGKDAFRFLQFLTTNDMSKLVDGKACYAVMCNENGGSVDDCFVYRFDCDHYMVVVNAGNIKKDYDWMVRHLEGFDVEIEDESDGMAKLDLQGPKSEEVLSKLVDLDLKEVKRFHFVNGKVYEVDCIISRTGYTGEDGFELYFDANFAERIWKKMLEAGTEFGIKPIGLGARDTLRIESCYSLYGHELTDTIGPVEAGIGWVVRKKEEDFIGKDVLLKQKIEGVSMINVGIDMVGRGIAREHYPIFIDGNEVGHVSSGTFSPSLKKSIAMGFIDSKYNVEGTEVDIKIRDNLVKAEVIKKPFYKYREGEEK